MKLSMAPRQSHGVTQLMYVGDTPAAVQPGRKYALVAVGALVVAWLCPRARGVALLGAAGAGVMSVLKRNE